MKKAGVVGHPVAHSLSPKLHGYWLKHYGIDGEYKAYDIAPENLAQFFETMEAQGFVGCNFTIPHKERALELVDIADDLAVAVGAVNTVMVKDGKTVGTNTDVAGFYENLKPYVSRLAAKDKQKAVVLGAGGAARAVVVALRQLGFGSIIVTNRSADKAEALARQHGLISLPWNEREAALLDADLLVNTTSLGLAGQPPLELSLATLPAHAIVTDIVYKPLMTPLLEAAKARGLTVVDGLGMLLYQAAPGFAAWFGRDPEVTEELRAHILGA